MMSLAMKSRVAAALGVLAFVAILSQQQILDTTGRRLSSYFRELAPVGPPLEWIKRFKDTWSYPPHSTDVPFVWYIPMSKANSLVTIMHRCYDLRSVFHLGYDTSSHEGLQKMHEENALAHFFNDDDDGDHEGFDYFYSPYLFESSTLFTEDPHAGRLIVSFREPNRRLLSLFLKLKLIDDPVVADMTFIEYVNSTACPDNWITRSLIDKMTGALDDQDHLKSLQAVRKKAFVILSDTVENKTQSLRNLERYYDWSNQGEEDCIDMLLKLDEQEDVEFPRGTADWRFVSERNHYDNMLHYHVKEIFGWQTEELAKEHPFQIVDASHN